MYQEYKNVIDILRAELDWEEVVVRIAKEHPGIVCAIVKCMKEQTETIEDENVRDVMNNFIFAKISRLDAINKYADITFASYKQAEAMVNSWWNKERCTETVCNIRDKYEKGQYRGKIEAIKDYRNATGSGLKEAKDVVLGWYQHNNYSYNYVS